MEIIVTPLAIKQFQKLPISQQTKVTKKLQLLQTDPYAGKKLGGELQEIRTVRAWPYRILYYIDTKNKKLFITSILHRQGAYK